MVSTRKFGNDERANRTFSVSCGERKESDRFLTWVKVARAEILHSARDTQETNRVLERTFVLARGSW